MQGNAFTDCSTYKSSLIEKVEGFSNADDDIRSFWIHSVCFDVPGSESGVLTCVGVGENSFVAVVYLWCKDANVVECALLRLKTKGEVPINPSVRDSTVVTYNQIKGEFLIRF